jgi:hypothetical protein
MIVGKPNEAMLTHTAILAGMGYFLSMRRPMEYSQVAGFSRFKLAERIRK